MLDYDNNNSKLFHKYRAAAAEKDPSPKVTSIFLLGGVIGIKFLYGKELVWERAGVFSVKSRTGLTNQDDLGLV